MSTLENLDSDISDLNARITTLKAHRANLSTILLSQPHLPARLEQRPVLHEQHRREAAKSAKIQSKRNLENVYRACAGVTAFKVKDPDPYAVDDGNVLGVRIDISIGGRFVETYNVLFNRPDMQHKNMLKIHKHTIPPCIPLQPLANKWLPMTRKDAETTKEQDLVKFGRSLRKELVSWHLRLEAVEKLRLEAGLKGRANGREKENEQPTIGKVLNAFMSDDESEEDYEEQRLRNGPVKIADIEADAAGREITMTWTNGIVGVMKVTKDGEVEKAIVRSKDGVRESALGRKALGRIEGLVQRLIV
jgi:central kinetochore subunit Mal2/MCM21